MFTCVDQSAADTALLGSWLGGFSLLRPRQALPLRLNVNGRMKSGA